MAPCASGQGLFRTDSLHLDLQWQAMSDSLLPGLEIEMEAGGRIFHPSDSTRLTLLKGSRISAWAQFSGGRVQFNHSLPRFQDTVACALWCDTLGSVLLMDDDTLRFPWRSQSAGCFPAAHDHELNRVLRNAMAEPFESKRLAQLQPWIAEKCLTPEQLRRCAATFDDEERKLQLLQDASCTAPSRLHEVGAVFSSERYRNRFLEWIQSRR